MGLGSTVHDGAALGDKLVEEPGVADVAHDELDPVRGQPGDVLPPPRVGQLVQHGHMHAGMVLHHIPHEVRPDEPATACDEDVPRIEVISAQIRTQSPSNSLVDVAPDSTEETLKHHPPSMLSIRALVSSVAECARTTGQPRHLHSME